MTSYVELCLSVDVWMLRYRMTILEPPTSTWIVPVPCVYNTSSCSAKQSTKTVSTKSQEKSQKRVWKGVRARSTRFSSFASTVDPP